MLKIKMDSRYIYVLVIIIISLSILRPMGLPLVVSDSVRMSYTEIDSLPPGSDIFFNYDLAPAVWSEWGPTTVAVLKHLLSKPLNVILVSTTLAGPSIFENEIKPEITELLDQKKYGEDWVNMGYIAGAEVAMAAIADDVHKALPKDVYGTPIEDLQIFDNIKTGEDFELAIQ